MKKLSLLIMPLMAISFLMSCGGGGGESHKTFNVTFDGGEYLNIEKTTCEENVEFTTKVFVKDEYRGNYEVPQSEAYYEVTINDQAVKNFTITADDSFNSVNLTIPKEAVTGDIKIKTEGYCHYLTFTAEEDNAKIYTVFSYNKFEPSPKLQYCDNLNNPKWKDWEIGEESAITLKKSETIYVKNTINTFSNPEGKLSTKEIVNFKTGKKNDPKVFADGNIMSLLNFADLYTNCFRKAFADAATLVGSPKLPATTLPYLCYDAMFSYCSALVTAPILPAITLEAGCYMSMFESCSALVNAPELPATTLMMSCYLSMFNGCSALVNAPELPATTLVENCYERMFYGCSALVTAPKLPATTLVGNCYTDMFSDCSALVNAPELPATTLVENCYKDMFNGCSNLKYIKVGFGDGTNWPEVEYCTDNWLSGVADGGTFVWNGSTDKDELSQAKLLDERGSKKTENITHIPADWTVQNPA